MLSPQRSGFSVHLVCRSPLTPRINQSGGHPDIPRAPQAPQWLREKLKWRHAIFCKRSLSRPTIDYICRTGKPGGFPCHQENPRTCKMGPIAASGLALLRVNRGSSRSHQPPGPGQDVRVLAPELHIGYHPCRRTKALRPMPFL